MKDEDEVTQEEIYKFIMAVGNDTIKNKWTERKQKKERSEEDIIEILAQRTVAGGGIMGYEQHHDVLRWTGGRTFYDRRRVGPVTAQRFLVSRLNDFEEDGLDGMHDTFYDAQLEIAQMNTIIEILN